MGKAEAHNRIRSIENAAADHRHGVVQTAVPILLLINDIGAAVLGVIGLGVTQGAWALLTKADRFDLAGVHAQQAHHARNGFRATLAQCLVVLRTATGVGVAFDTNALLRVATQIVGVHFDQATVLLGNGVAVEFEIHGALLRQRALRVERVHDLTRAGAVGSGTGGACLIQGYRAASRQGGRQCGKGKASCDARAHLISLKKSLTNVLIGERAPNRFADLAIQCGERLSYATVNRCDGKYAAAILYRAVKDLHAIWCKAWGFVVRACREQLLRSVGQVQETDSES